MGLCKKVAWTESLHRTAWIGPFRKSPTPRGSGLPFCCHCNGFVCHLHQLRNNRSSTFILLIVRTPVGPVVTKKGHCQSPLRLHGGSRHQVMIIFHRNLPFFLSWCIIKTDWHLWRHPLLQLKDATSNYSVYRTQETCLSGWLGIWWTRGSLKKGV